MSPTKWPVPPTKKIPALTAHFVSGVPMTVAGNVWAIQAVAGAKNCPFLNKSPSTIR
jgi:hypothetical protein